MVRWLVCGQLGVAGTRTTHLVDDTEAPSCPRAGVGRQLTGYGNAIEDTGDGLESLLGQRVEVWCANYIYGGVLVGVSGTFLKLDPASVVYVTGPLDATEWKDAQRLVRPAFVLLSAVEMVTTKPEK